MSNPVKFFLMVLVPPLAGFLAWLSWKTLPGYWIGWFLLVISNIFFWGFIITCWIRRKPLNDPAIEGQTTHEEKSDFSFWLILPGMLAAFFLSPIEAYWFPGLLPHTITFQTAGVLISLFSVALFVWARRETRKNYSGHLRVTDTQELVTSGPYRYIRHPAYLSYLLMSLGIGLGYSSLIGICSVPLILLPGFIYRIRVEEKLLVIRFGNLYRNYSLYTSKLFPKIW